MMMNLSLALSLLCLATPVSAGFLDAERELIVPMPMHSYPEDCGKDSLLKIIPSAAAMLQQDNVPGAGIDEIYNKSKFEPFKTVEKDGYISVDCVKDYMYYRGDKYGDHKVDYKLQDVSRVSIVHYDAFVAKKDRVEMTHTVCFEFCRTLPNMGYFGITNGRSCYCTPYFTAMESDSEQCDAACPGDDSIMCGGKAKSSIFAMHTCGSTSKDLSARANRGRDLVADMKDKVKAANNFVTEMETIANDIMPRFSKVGDSGASNLAQKAKEMSSGVLKHKADEAEKLANLLKAHSGEASDLSKDPKVASDAMKMTKAEHLMDEIDETVAQAEESTNVLDEMMSYVSPPKPYYETSNALKNYMPIMYFIDQAFDGIDDPKNPKMKGKAAVPSTCTGDLVGLPIVGKDAKECAQVCDDNLVKGCVGFQHFDSKSYGKKKGKMCFLFSKFNTGFFYTGCKDETQATTGCYAKFSKFAGGKFEGSGTLKPGGFSGKPFCKECFKKFTKADRCYAK